jgi:sigma-E factor negative regulatory protein RseA
MKPESIPRVPIGLADLPVPAGDERLSALADGETQALDAACAQWRDDPRARRAWHAYHLIGDVMRSEELARQPVQDADFLARLHARLVLEPVLPAPAALPATRVDTPRPAWALPVAAAAGLAVVTGALLVARMGAAVEPGRTPVEMAAATNKTVASGVGPERRQVLERQAVIVDPRLEEFLRVHQASGGGMAGVGPGGTLRRVDIVVPVSPGR